MLEEVFCDLPDLHAIYVTRTGGGSTGVIGVFAYIVLIASGLKRFATLTRKAGIDIP